MILNQLNKTRFLLILLVVGLAVGFVSACMEKPTIYLTIPADRYPAAAQHASDAIKAGHSAICTVDRKGAKDRREQSLANTPVKHGYDRDEFPMAMCREGGTGADIRYIDPSDNRGAGAWVGNKLKGYPNGTKIIFQN